MIDPVAFKLGGISLRWYGLLVAAGFLVATAVWCLLDRRAGHRRGFGLDFGFVGMTGGVLGARLLHVLTHLDYYRLHPADLVRPDRGGLVFYGGLLAALLATALLARANRRPWLALLDYGCTGLAFGHALGRVGCFLNGCCLGRPTSGPLAVVVDGIERHPVQLYEAGFNVLLGLVLLRAFLRPHRHGTVTGLYLVGYSSWRFAAEFLRAEPRWLGSLSQAQVFSLVLLPVGLFLLARRGAEAPA